MLNKIFFLILIVSMVPQFSMAQKMGLVAGFGQMSLEAESGMGKSPTSDGGYQLGALFYGDLESGIGGRVGVLLSEKDFSQSTGSTTGKISSKLSYLQVPLTGTLALAPNFAFFGGVDLNLNVSKSCSSNDPAVTCSTDGVKSSFVGATLGATLTFMDSFGAEMFYQKALSKVIDYTQNASIIGINLIYIIE